MKYIIELVKNEDFSSLNIFLFNDDIIHENYPRHKYGKPVSAGFCHLKGGHVYTYGKSATLNLGINKKDSKILEAFLFGYFEQQRILLSELYQ